MAKEINTKSVVLDGSIRTKEVDSERRIIFVASSSNVDRHYESVDVPSLRLPLKAGSIDVGAIPKEGVTDIVDIPLMLNHSGDVRDVIGSVRTAYYENNELIFEAGISNREIAQEMLTLIEEGHLSNAFSITMSDYDFNYDSETISNAEVIEVSLVYRGSNKDARLLAVKSLIGGDMKEKQNETFGDATGEVKDQPVEAEVKEESTSEATEETKTPETPEQPETGEQETDDTKENTDKEETDVEKTKKIAKDEVVEKATQKTQNTNSGYLKTKAALADFKDLVLKSHRGTNEQIMKNWMDHLKTKDVSGDAILPSKIEQIFFKTWTDNPGILGTFSTLNVKAGSVYAMSSSDTAKGHKKGTEKADQEVASVRRDLKALAIYKKLSIDLQDLFDDESGELLAFRAKELAERVANAIAVGAILGQGTGDNATLQGGRGLNPMITDIEATSGFGTSVATKVTGGADDGNYEHAVRALSAVKDNNNGKILVVPTGFMAEIRLAKDNNGGLLFPIGADVAAAIGAKQIFEIDEMVGSEYKAIAYADKSYVLVGESSASVRTDFDLVKNQDVMLVERYVGGSQQGYKTLAGVVSA